MKWSICLVLLTVVFVKAAPTRDYIKGRYKRDEACLETVNIDRKVIDMAVATQYFPSDDQKYKEYLACSYKKQGFQTSDGVIQYNQIKDFLSTYYDKSDLERITCMDFGDSHGDKAFNALSCVIGYLRSIDIKS